MAVNPSPFGPKPQFELSDGTPAVGNQIFFYVAGSVGTKQNTYTDSTGGSANANPIVLNSLGQPTTQIWFTAGQSYKVVYAPSTDTDPPTSPIWTVDNLLGINDTTSAQTEWIAGPAPTFISATTFSLVGDQTATFTLARRIKTTNTSGTIYSTIINSVFGAATTVTVKNDSGVLDSGLSAVSYGLISASHPSLPASTVNAQPVCLGRLTLTSGTAVTTSDVTAATSVFFTPYKGNAVDLYDGTANWIRYTFSELTLAVPATTSQMYDIFLQNNAGTLQLNAVAWTNDTTRATALVLQNGVYVKSGATTQLYLGSFRTTTVSGQTEDSLAKRYVWNYYNRLPRLMRVLEATDSWTYTTATLRQANGSTANQLDMVIGVAEDFVTAEVRVAASNNGASASALLQVGIGGNSTTVNSTGLLTPTTANVSGVTQQITASLRGFAPVGRNFFAWLEYSTAAGTTTWTGDNGAPATQQSGIHGEMMG